MKNLIVFALCVAGIWHMYFFFSSNSHITGIFKSEPNVGYVWANEDTTEPHYFWENTEAKWQTGFKHPNYNVIAADEGKWGPSLGYEFANSDPKDLTTVWKVNFKHPYMNAYTTKEEGMWVPALGYKFEFDSNGSVINTVWNPGERFEKLKIIASEKQGYFIPFPEYSFVDPKNSLEVVYTPTLNNTSGTSEISADDQMAGGIAAVLLAGGIELIVGKNNFSDQLKEEAAKEFLIGGIKKLQQ